MKKLILLGIVVAIVALAEIYYFFPQAFFQQSADNSPKRFSSAEELNAFISANSEAGFYGSTGAVSEMSSRKSSSSDISQAPQTAAGESNAQPSGGSVDYSQTNIQVAGVDEADIVKTDGKYIYAVSGDKVSIVDAYPAESAKIVSTLEFNGSVGEIYINNDKLVVFGQKNYEYTIPETVTGASEIASKMITRPYYYSPVTFIDVYDVSDKASPKLARNVSVDGSYYDSRMIGDYVYLIAQQPAYNYGGGPVPLPVVRSNGAEKAVPVADIYYFGMPDSSFVFTNMLSLNTQSGEEPSIKTFLMGYSQNMYVSQNNIYMVYQKSVSETDIYSRMVNEAVIPIVPSEVQNKIMEIQNYNISAYSKMQEIGKLFETYVRSLSPEQAADMMKTMQEKAMRIQSEIAKEMEKTVIHKISISNGNIEYKTNGEVPGQPLNQFSMDEISGYFRIATTTSGNGGFFGGGFARPAVGIMTRSMQSLTAESAISSSAGQAKTAVPQVSQKMAQSAPALSQTTPQNLGSDAVSEKNESGIAAEEQKINEMERPIEQRQIVAPEPQVSGPLNHLYVLGGDLKIIGKVEDLAAGERIYSVRFMGDKAYMVTFRQIDPLFVIDLSSPQNPKVLGYLKVPGVSDYLHPYDETHIIGVGRDASEEGMIKGLKLALFDVSDFANPKEVSKYIIGDRGTSSDALYDHKAFLFDKEKNLLVIPVSEYGANWKNHWQGAYVFNIDLANGITLKGKVAHKKEDKPQDVSKIRAEGKFGAGLRFGGADDYAEIPDNSLLRPAGSIAVEAWIKADTNAERFFVSKGSLWEYGSSWYLYQQSGGQFGFLRNYGSGSNEAAKWVVSAGAYGDGLWHHVVATDNGANLSIYVDNILTGTVSVAGMTPYTGETNPLSLFRMGTRDYYYSGAIDEVRIYKRAVSAEEVSSRFNGNEISTDGLAGWWKFDETGNSTEVIDSSGKGNNGKITKHVQPSYYYDWSSQIRRSLFIGNTLYTVSNKMVKMNSLADLSEVNSVDFPIQDTGYPYRIY